MSEPVEPAEPLILWWMPLVALAAPLIWAAWKAVSDGAGDGLLALLWPGVALYLGSVAVLWAGWKIELE
jgi:hypothetical protein